MNCNEVPTSSQFAGNQNRQVALEELMLKSVDLVIGVNFVMLVVSLAVIFITQAAMNVLQTRGNNLRDGRPRLLTQAGRRLSDGSIRKIAHALLSHPLIKSSRYPLRNAVRIAGTARTWPKPSSICGPPPSRCGRSNSDARFAAAILISGFLFECFFRKNQEA